MLVSVCLSVPNSCVQLWDNVFMANTVHVTIRLPQELLDSIDSEAAAESRSRSFVITRRLHGNRNDDIRGAGSGQTRETERSRDNATLPILPHAKSPTKRLHPMQPMRNELATRRGLEPRSTTNSHQNHRVYRDGSRRWCSDCKQYLA